jgi:hypothetical protein
VLSSNIVLSSFTAPDAVLYVIERASTNERRREEKGQKIDRSTKQTRVEEE